MQFNSIDFAIFFPIVLIVYFVIPKKLRAIFLLAASYYFYMSWNAKYALLIAFSTIATYLSALMFKRFEKHKKLILAACIVVNLAILFLFKYADFAIDTLNLILSHFGTVRIGARLGFLLPVGISFYTFQALGYIIDVYRGDVEAERNIIKYALFVSFFPQLVAGPIERSRNLLGQIRNIEKICVWNAKAVTSGAILMVYGLFMKMVIADRASILADKVFNNYRIYGSVELILALIVFGIQIYCDFSSYSMIAIGAARIMGFKLMENFNAPYFATSIKDYWSRWHISLSSWFKDYLYFPLGGSRKGRARTMVNVMIIFLVSGLWHGANLTYILWGAIHGAFRVVEDLTLPLRQKAALRLQVRTDTFSHRLWQSIFAFLVVTFSWIFFRSATITDAFIYLSRIISRPDPWVLFNDGLYTLGLKRPEMNILIVSVVILFLVDLIREKKKMTIDKFLMEQNLWFEWLVIIGFILMILTFGKYGPAFDAKQFIYFQF